MGVFFGVLMKSGLRIAAAWHFSLLVVAAGAGLAGCGRSDVASQVAAMNDSNIRRVANLYMAFQIRHGFEGPKDEAEFKGFIQNEMPPEKLKLMLIDPSNLDETFKSESNGEGFEIVYGLKGFLGSQMAVAFDQPSSYGKRRVAFTGGPVDTIDDQQYQQLKENPLRNSENSQSNGPESNDGL